MRGGVVEVGGELVVVLALGAWVVGVVGWDGGVLGLVRVGRAGM